MKPCWEIRAAADDPRAGEIFLYGPIDGDPPWLDDEQTPLRFVQALQDLGDIDTLDVRINSPGGNVFAGQAMYSILRRHNARKTVTVDGLAASAASVVAMAGDEVVMPTNAMMMVHNPHGLSMGFATDHRKAADDLDQIREGMIAAYRDKTGLRRSEIIKIMDAETWLTATEAKEKGFADRVESRRIAASMATDNLLVINGIGVQLNRYESEPPVHLITDAFKDNADQLLGQVAAFAARTESRADSRRTAGRPVSDTDIGYWQTIKATADRILEAAEPANDPAPLVDGRDESEEASVSTLSSAELERAKALHAAFITLREELTK